MEKTTMKTTMKCKIIMEDDATIIRIEEMITSFQSNCVRKYKNDRERALCADVLLDDILALISCAKKQWEDDYAKIR